MRKRKDKNDSHPLGIKSDYALCAVYSFFPSKTTPRHQMQVKDDARNVTFRRRETVNHPFFLFLFLFFSLLHGGGRRDPVILLARLDTLNEGIDAVDDPTTGRVLAKVDRVPLRPGLAETYHLSCLTPAGRGQVLHAVYPLPACLAAPLQGIF